MIELLQHQFVQNAFIAGTIVAIVAAVIGYFVVLRAQAFTGHSLAHIGFAGATGAAVFGLSSLVGTFIFTILAAIGMGALGERIRGRDVEVGMILSFALGLGVLFLKLYTTNSLKVVGILFGSIFSVTSSDLVLSVVSGIVTLSVLLFLFRPLLFASIDPEVAEARGVPVRFLSIIFMLLLAMTVAEAVLVVGILLVFALLVAPAAAAQHLTNRPYTTILYAIGLGLLCTWGGLLLSLIVNWPASFFIAGLASVSYLFISQIKHVVAPHFYAPKPHPHSED